MGAYSTIFAYFSFAKHAVLYIRVPTPVKGLQILELLNGAGLTLHFRVLRFFYAFSLSIVS